MDKNFAQAFLESFLERIEHDVTSGKWRIGTISAKEKDAIEFALNLLRGTDPTSQLVNPPIKHVDSFEINLNLHSLDFSEPQDKEVTFCLDFGTAMSKAFAIKGDQELIELALGTHAGATSGYPVESSLFISDDGTLYFGPQAISQSEKAGEAGRMRFDSPKARLSHGLQGDIDRNKVKDDINPTSIPVTEGDLITLYLAYLTDMACSELENNGISRYTARRFARPCWDEARNDWAEKHLKRMLAQAQILGDTFHDKWASGIPLITAKTAIDKVKSLGKEPSYLIQEGVAEPVAAAASPLIKGDDQRELFMVIDVGAGTTDFGLFLIQENPEADKCIIRIVPGTVQYLPQAGDRVDSLLKKFILDESGVDQQDSDGELIAAALQNHIRTYKEILFRDGLLEYQLSNHFTGVIKKEDFLNSTLVKNFAKQIENKFIGILSEIGEGFLDLMYMSKLNVVLTGGGASLPMIERLARWIPEINGKKIICKEAPRVPEWVVDNYDQLAHQYPQLAVAIGGANPTLPQMGKSFNDFGGLRTKTYV